MHYRFWGRGPALGPVATATIAGTSLLTALLSGIDYIVTPEDSHLVLTSIEHAISLDAWGVYTVLAACLAAIGALSNRWWITILGHSALAGIYGAFGSRVFI